MRKTVVALVAPALVALTGCSTLQADADAEAAVLADRVLPQALDRAVSRADARSPEQRRDAALDWLADPGDPALEGQRGVTWVVQGTPGTTDTADTAVRVDVYLYLESGDLLPPDQGEATWGVACRSYDVAAAVASSTVACPAGTPATP